MGCTTGGESGWSDGTGGAGDPAGQETRQRMDAGAASLAGSLLDAARRGVPAERAAQQHLRHDQGPALHAAVATQLRSQLTHALSESWRRGWQPSDVVHTARRSLADGAVAALRKGIREELGRYARSTVDPRWWEQVDGLVADAAAGRSRRARARAGTRVGTGPPDRTQECGDVLAATVFVERLPTLEVLGPLPGAAGGGTPSGDVDDRLLTKVRRLLAQAEGTPYEAEAETFTAAAHSLMTRHRIDRAMLEATDGRDAAARGPGGMRLPVERPYEQPKVLLLSVIASANRCRTLWDERLGLATVIGHAADRRAVEILFTSLLVQATTALHREGVRRDSAARTRGFRSSFLRGFAARVGQRLQEAGDAAEEQARTELGRSAQAGGEWPAAGGSDRMGLVLRRRDEEVEELVRRLFPHAVRTRSRPVTDAAGWRQGRAAADRASLGLDGRLTDGAA